MSFHSHPSQQENDRELASEIDRTRNLEKLNTKRQIESEYQSNTMSQSDSTSTSNVMPQPEVRPPSEAATQAGAKPRTRSLTGWAWEKANRAQFRTEHINHEVDEMTYDDSAREHKISSMDQPLSKEAIAYFKNQAIPIERRQALSGTQLSEELRKTELQDEIAPLANTLGRGTEKRPRLQVKGQKAPVSPFIQHKKIIRPPKAEGLEKQ